MTPSRLIALITPILLLLILPQSYCAAQDKSKIQFAKTTPNDFKSAGGAADTADAVILSDYGCVHFIGNKHSFFSKVFTRHTRILVRNKKAFDLSTVEIPLYVGEDDAEKVDNIIAASYRLENGQVVETKLDKGDIFEDKQEKNHREIRFTVPGVKEGAIIEYSYAVTSPYIHSLPAWNFQTIEYPVRHSEFEVEIPQALFYVLVRQGIHPYAEDKGSEGKGSYRLEHKSTNGYSNISEDLFVSALTMKHRWVMKDVPPCRIESYISTPKNYLDRIELQLSKTYDGQDYHDYHNTWAQTTKQLLEQEDFGHNLYEGTEWLDNLIQKITGGITDPLQQAKAIYYYLQTHLTCTNHYDMFVKTDLKDVLKKNSGTVGDLNLLLVAMLARKGFTVAPVVLSTREYGFNLAKYPVLDRLNYVVVRLSLLGTVYYLDVAHPQLGFGQMAGNCYNGHARIISAKDSGSVYFEADSLRERKTTMVFLTAGEKGLGGTYQSVLGSLQSYNTRASIGKMGAKEFFNSIQASYGEDASISAGHLDSLDRKEDPVTIRYDIQLNQPADASLIYLNPFFGDALRENPFQAAERKYPVEMDHTIDNLYLFNMEVPDGYLVDELPKSARVSLNENQGSFEYLLAHEGNVIQMRCRLKLNKAVFAPDDYANLRDFYAFIVKKESEQIVLKKKS